MKALMAGGKTSRETSRTRAAVLLSLAFFGCSANDASTDEPFEPGRRALADDSTVERPTDLDGGLDGGVSMDAGAFDETLFLASQDTAGSRGRERLLLLGFDRSGKLPGRTDSIMIVVADHARGEIGVVSIPRDLWVDIPGWEPGRINKVYRVGEMLHGEGGGAALMKRVVREELGVAIDHVAAVDFSGFVEVVDLLGGIDVDVACPIMDNFVSSGSPTGYVSLTLEAGRRRLDGATALLFSRSRHGRGDADRAARQQAVLVGLKNRLASPRIIPRLPALLSSLRRHVDTDVDLAGAFRLAGLASRAKAGAVHGAVVAEPLVYEWRSPEGQSVVRLDRPGFDRLMARLFEAPSPLGRSGRVCRPADAALNWREQAKERKERKRKAARTVDEGTDASVSP